MADDSTQPSGRVAGKVALVTGAGSGIGRATAVVLAREGAVVYCADLDQAAAELTAVAILAGDGRAQSCLLDVTSEPAWCAAVDRVLGEQGRLDIVVNCAGISFVCPIEDMSLEDWRRVLAVNLEGVFLGTKHAVRAMRRQPSGGSIVNVSSVSGVKAQPAASAYCTSKAGVIMLTKTVALECLRNKDNIRVNAVSPSGVKTAMWKSMPFFQELMAREGGEEAAFQAMVRGAPYGRFAEPEEIALAILYLASDESLFVTGTNLLIDQGDTA
jgi:NAD(P)-dependent dehydrogenase (short-subunit alcohol dehydrogenase family)